MATASERHAATPLGPTLPFAPRTRRLEWRPNNPVSPPGLHWPGGCLVGETEIALVDGENGRLIYRGHDAEELAQEATFEQVAVPAVERQAARRRRARRAARHADRGPQHRPTSCSTRCGASSRTSSRWTPCARASRRGACRATRTAAGTSRTRSGRSRRSPRSSPTTSASGQGLDVVAPDASLRFVDNYLLKLTGKPPRRRAPGPSTRTSPWPPSTG